MKKIVTIVGARPQFIKAAAVSRAIAAMPKGTVNEVIVHTGQHYDENMSDLFFREMDIPKPKYNLGIHGSSHGKMTGEMLAAIEPILLEEMPAAVLVYGDTNSTLAGAMAASKLHIPVAHVEAGLRSFNMKMPEEINRILTDQVATCLFCPTEAAVENLRAEGYFSPAYQNRSTRPSIHKVGDVMLDAALHYRKTAAPSGGLSSLLTKIGRSFGLATIHRAENTDSHERLREIFSALDTIAKEMPIILPLHPRTRKIAESLGLRQGNLHIIDPVGYFDMVSLLDRCQIVLTDSGGLQKEAYFFGKFCLTLRDQTEWVELVNAGVNRLVGADARQIVKEFSANIGRKIPDGRQFYGNGQAGCEIVRVLVKEL